VLGMDENLVVRVSTTGLAVGTVNERQGDYREVVAEGSPNRNQV